ncbi:unnamed protein product [Brachionus calyciflorus]|uniref:Spt20-like SEP domain-containing protein n=1 Tax=Brachionus calyciflorus TaxID=104777 RepID=A0A814FDJ4_9BILA|nr:unnamed protein product [Brachionus calyciflorus]
MFDIYDDDKEEKLEKKTKYFGKHTLNLKNNFTNRLKNQFMEYDDDENSDDHNESDSKKLDFCFESFLNTKISTKFKNQRQKNVLESDKKLDLSKSNKNYPNNLAKNKIDSYLNRPLEILCTSKSTDIFKISHSLKVKLLELYLEENKRLQKNFIESKYVNYSTNLLEKLVNREKYNTLVLNLYSLNEGFTIGFNIELHSHFDSKNDIYNLNNIETKHLSYVETDIFFYINTGEIPPIIIDLINNFNINLFYDGCLILEIRDYRRNNLDKNLDNSYQYDLKYLLLQPSMQTLLADINSITKNGNFIWTQEDKYALESQLLLATSQPLCLEPNPVVSIIKNKILSYKYMLNDRCLKKLSLRHSEEFLLRALKYDEYELPNPFRILKIRKKFSNENSNLIHNSFLNKNEITSTEQNNKLMIDLNGNNKSNNVDDVYSKEAIENCLKSSKSSFKLPQQDSILVKYFTKIHEPIKYSVEPNLIPIEELILEAEDKTSKNNFSKIVILRQSIDGIYYCQLSLRCDQKNEISYRLGSALDAEKYIQQYVKIFTEEGRRQVNLKHNLIEKSTDNKSAISYSTLKKNINTSMVNSCIPFQNIFPNKNLNDKQLQSYQMFLQQEFQQQRNHLENLRRSRSTSSDDSNSNLKNLITQNSIINSAPVISQNLNTPKIYANIQPIRSQSINQTPSAFQSSTNIITLSQKQQQDTNETQNGPISYQKVNNLSNNSSTNLSSIQANSTNSGIIQVLVPKLVQGTQNLNQTTIKKISPQSQIQQNIQNQSSNIIVETLPKNITKKSPKNKTTSKRQTKKRSATTTTTTTPASTTVTNISSTHSQINLAPKISNEISSDQNFKPAKIINSSNLSLYKKIAIDNRSVPVIVTLNSDSKNSNKLTLKPNEEVSPVKTPTNISSPIKTIQFLQKSTPVINLNSTQNKFPIYNHHEITTVTPIASSPIKKTNNQDYHKSSASSSITTNVTTGKPHGLSKQQHNYIMQPSIVKTMPINNSKSLTTVSNSLDNNQDLLNHRQLNNNNNSINNSNGNNQPTQSVILLTNHNSNTSLQKSNSIN